MSEHNKHYPIWVISTGRVGSTFMSKLLSGTTDNRSIEHQVPGARPINILGNLACAGRLSPNIAENLSRTFFGLKSGESTTDPLRSMLHVAEIKKGNAPENLKVVHIVRDPRDFITSFMSWKNQVFRRKVLHHVIPFWQPNPWLTGEASLPERMRMDKFEHFCWVWNYKNRLFESIEDQCDYKRFRLEDITTASGASDSLTELKEFLGLDSGSIPKEKSRQKVNASKKSFPKWGSWPPREAKLLHRHCGELMENYGYGGEHKWIKLLNK